MGLFRDVRKLSAAAEEIQQDWDPAEQMRDARRQMQAMPEQSQLAVSPTARRSPATVVALRDTRSMVDHQLVLECDVTVVPDGGVPFPATLTVIGVACATTLQPGATVTVAHEPDDRQWVVLL